MTHLPIAARPATGPAPLSVGALLVAALVAAAALGGCAGEPKQEPPPLQPSPRTAAQPLTAPSVETKPLESAKPSYRGPWEDPSSPLYKRTIYFDYDSAEVRPEYLDVIRTHSGYLGTASSTRVTLEGHSDERGTREYNLALGDRRAESVRQLMLAEGVGPGQLNTLSYGEERPSHYGHDDESWRQNRRVIIQY